MRHKFLDLSLKLSFSSLYLLPNCLMAADAPSTHEIKMKSISYEPRTLEIHVNDSVVWSNDSYTDHSATSDTKDFDTGFVKPKNKSKPVVFTKVGSFSYHCSTHGKTMSGLIVVK